MLGFDGFFNREGTKEEAVACVEEAAVVETAGNRQRLNEDGPPVRPEPSRREAGIVSSRR
jgi:hypothetical protein